MKKSLIIFGLTILLLITSSVTALAAPGFNLGFGYNQYDSDLGVGIFGNELVSLHTPAKMFTIDLGYEVNDWLAFNGQYSWGTTDLFSVLNDVLVIDQENTIWQIESAFDWDITNKTNLTFFVGYSNNKAAGNLNILNTIYGDLTTKVSGWYVGPMLTYTVNDRFDLGAAYRYSVNPDGEISLHGMGSLIVSGDLDDVSYSTLELFAKAAISEKWTLKAMYSYSWLDYSIGPVTVSRDLNGLSLTANYQF